MRADIGNRSFVTHYVSLNTTSCCIAIGLRDHSPATARRLYAGKRAGGDNPADARDDAPYALARETRLQLAALGDEVFIWDSAIRIAREFRL